MTATSGTLWRLEFIQTRRCGRARGPKTSFAFVDKVCFGFVVLWSSTGLVAS
jgi:hypothetical protein